MYQVADSVLGSRIQSFPYIAILITLRKDKSLRIQYLFLVLESTLNFPPNEGFWNKRRVLNFQKPTRHICTKIKTIHAQILKQNNLICD